MYQVSVAYQIVIKIAVRFKEHITWVFDFLDSRHSLISLGHPSHTPQVSRNVSVFFLLRTVGNSSENVLHFEGKGQK